MTVDKAAAAKAWREANQDQVKAYRAANRERRAEQFKTWSALNRDRKNELHRKWSARNRQKVKVKFDNWREANIAQSREQQAGYRRSNLAKMNAISAKKRASKRRATPPWLNSRHRNEIESLYARAAVMTEQTGVKHHVDHIEPLAGADACGLHVPWNLRVIPASENIKKGNRRLAAQVLAALMDVLDHERPAA